MERLTASFRLHNQEPFPKRLPKVSFGRPLLPFVLSRKEVPASARGAYSAPAELPVRQLTEKIISLGIIEI
ncbi:MAG: hypothetical protein E7512_04515 [[Clostridium] sporosphaeroides]|uniref:Uncharacterized protein n=1 Tax=Faecalispora sporosphaeroides TaxID=1549 RepID=A0A928KQQ8_9FIRM|nr:hypothetical protein [Faecalispora sporosphaeroides]